MLFQKGIYVREVADALIIALDIVKQKLQLVHQTHRILIGGLKSLVEIIGIFPGIFQGSVRGVDIAVVLPNPVRGQVVEQVDDFDGIIGDGYIFLKRSPLIFKLQPAGVPELPEQQMGLAGQSLVALSAHFLRLLCKA